MGTPEPLSRRRRTVGIAALAMVLFLAAGVGFRDRGDGGYHVTFVFPGAANLISGSRVQIDGFDAGTVTALEPKDGQALVRVRLKGDRAPLHAGTSARIGWLSMLGERIVHIEPGDRANPALPDGAMVTGNTPRVEIDQLLSALDPPTREAVARLAPDLDAALAGHEGRARETLETAGPALDALTDVLAAVGEDGPALRRLLTSVREMSGRLVARKDAIRSTIDGFDRNLQALAGKDDALRAGLEDLPATLRQASATLGRIPATARAVLPLLADLRPTFDALGPAARDLRPFLAELRPTLAELRPMVVALGAALAETPSTFDRAHSVLPDVTRAVSALLPAIDFLRPYTPEAVGALTNLNSATANYDSNGHYLRIYVSAGSASMIGGPGGLSPALRQNPRRSPGELEGQPVDAAGSRVR